MGREDWLLLLLRIYGVRIRLLYLLSLESTRSPSITALLPKSPSASTDASCSFLSSYLTPPTLSPNVWVISTIVVERTFTALLAHIPHIAVFEQLLQDGQLVRRQLLALDEPVDEVGAAR
jgi:hypothetical protein